MDKSRIINLAKYEVGWWKSHHRKDLEGLRENMAKLYSLQFNISPVESLKAVEFRVQATKEHDTAEKFEDAGKQKEADKHWKKAEKLLEKHFKKLKPITK